MRTLRLGSNMLLLPQSEMRKLRFKRRSSTNRRRMSEEKARKARETFSSIETTTPQNRPNIDQTIHEVSGYDSVIQNQGNNNTPPAEGKEQQPPVAIQKSSPDGTADSLSSAIGHQLIQAFCTTAQNIMPKSKPKPPAKHSIDTRDAIFQVLVDRGQLINDKVLKRHGVSAVIDSLARGISLFKETVQRVVVDCEARGIYKQEGPIESFHNISEVISDMAYALEGQKYKTLVELEQLLGLILEILVMAKHIVERSEVECEGGDLSGMQLGKVHGMFSACRISFKFFGTSDKQISRLLGDEFSLHLGLVRMFLTH